MLGLTWLRKLCELGFAEKRIGVEPSDQGVRLRASTLDQGPENILPAKQAIREEIEAGFPLNLNPSRQVLLKSRLDRRLVGAPSVQASGRFHDILGSRIKAVLIGKNLDRLSLSTRR